jgi:hypothetical protein
MPNTIPMETQKTQEVMNSQEKLITIVFFFGTLVSKCYKQVIFITWDNCLK